MALSDLYQQTILAHNRAPANRGELNDATHSARGQDALCGDDLVVWLRVGPEGRVERAVWSGEACAITTASASMLTDWVVGRTLEEIRRGDARFRALLDDPEIPDAAELGDFNALRAVGQYPSRVRNALLPWETAIRALVSDE